MDNTYTAMVIHTFHTRVGSGKLKLSADTDELYADRNEMINRYIDMIERYTDMKKIYKDMKKRCNDMKKRCKDMKEEINNTGIRINEMNKTYRDMMYHIVCALRKRDDQSDLPYWSSQQGPCSEK